MTTTSTFSGLEPNNRSSSRVLRPPGGGSSFSFGVSEQQAQPVRRHKMASNIFGVPDEPAPVSHTQETDAPAPECEDLDAAAHRTCQSADCEDVGSNMGEAEVPEPESGKEQAADLVEPAPPAQAPSRRNPPGGKSSLILG